MVFGGISNTHTYDWEMTQKRNREHTRKIQAKLEDIFKEFEGKTISRLKKNEPIVGKSRTKEIKEVGKSILEITTDRDIKEVSFGCGCEDRKHLLAGNYNKETGLYEVDIGKYSMIEEVRGYINLDSMNRLPEIVILNMFANKSGFGCKVQENYPDMYVRFIAGENMRKHPELYRALANSDQSRIFQRYYEYEDGTPVSDGGGYGYYNGTTMKYSIAEAVKDKIGLK